MINDDELLEDALFITMTFRAKCTRIIGNTLTPSVLEITTDVVPNPESSEDDMTSALAKIKYFIENIFSGSVVFSLDNKTAFGSLFDEDGKSQFANSLVFTPGQPTDNVLATVLSAKMNALGDGVVHFASCDVESDNPFGMSATFVGEQYSSLPPMDSWVPGNNFFTKPWWHRDDASSIDIPTPEGEEPTRPAWAFSLDQNEKKAPVSRPKFKPKVIDGGKTESGKTETPNKDEE